MRIGLTIDPLLRGPRNVTHKLVALYRLHHLFQFGALALAPNNASVFRHFSTIYHSGNTPP